MASNDDDWVADVRRWYFDEREAASRAAPEAAASAADSDSAIGYETAHPGLQQHLRAAASDEGGL
jgi:hypothetical protein